jgi:hypothetical protein
MNQVAKIFASFALIAAFLGLALFFFLIGDAKGAPQEASLSAMILAVVVPMYVVARCFEMLGASSEKKKADS